jgi:single-strand DNA-binding protein
MELDVAEIGASLRWATVTVAKATRTNGGGAPSAVTADAWSSTPAPTGAGSRFADEPPF